MSKSILMKNTIIILITSLIVKVIGMIGKILSTRILGLEGMNLYVLSYPTLLLFVSISGFSLNNSISKLVAEGIATKRYSPKKLLLTGIKISLIISLICTFFYALSIKYISYNLLKNKNLYFPLLSGVILIPLVGTSDALRGYFNGLKKMNVASRSLFIEQLFRTISSVLGVYFGVKHSLVLANCLLFVGLSIGEISSILYCLYRIKKEKLIHYENTKNETKILLKTSSSLTLSKIIGSISYFLEPVIYTSILVYLKYSTKEIHDVYTTIDAYIIPLFTLASFLPFALSTAIIPHISETYVKNDINDLHNYISKVYTFSIYPSMFCLIIIFFFNAEIMKLIYNTSIGLDIIKKFSLMFIFYYINAITASILQAMGKIKILFVNSVLINLIRLILIVILSFISNIGVYSIIYAIMITLIFSTISLFYILSKETKFKLLPNTVFKFTIFILFFVSLISLLNLFNIYYIKVILLSGLFFILLFYSILRKKL